MRPNVLCVAMTVAVVVAACRADQSTGVLQPRSARVVDQTIGINVLLSSPPTPAQLAELGAFGALTGRLDELNAVFMRGRESDLPAIRALPFVLAANPDAERTGAPVDAVAATDFSLGINTWNLDAVNVTNIQPGPDRTVAYDGNGVYIGVLDTGLLDSWRQYFPQERIAEEYAASFTGGPVGAVAQQPNKWEHDQNSHGTHVTSTILGYRIGTTNINGSAPRAIVIPVKVLNQNGAGWSSMIAAGIVYIATLKAGPLAAHSVIINLSLGGARLDAVERAAVDFAIARGVIVVAAAGNRGGAGMIFPGAYAPVISVGASGWIGEWVGGGSWWVTGNVAEPTNPAHFYVPPFSSRAVGTQDLDVLAPGSWVVGPFQTQSGKTSYFFLGGTSMSTPHVAGMVGLMAQKHPPLTAAQAEAILQATAIALGPGTRTIVNPNGSTSSVSWGANATGSGLVTADAALAGTP